MYIVTLLFITKFHILLNSYQLSYPLSFTFLLHAIYPCFFDTDLLKHAIGLKELDMHIRYKHSER